MDRDRRPNLKSDQRNLRSLSKKASGLGQVRRLITPTSLQSQSLPLSAPLHGYVHDAEAQEILATYSSAHELSVWLLRPLAF